MHISSTVAYLVACTFNSLDTCWSWANNQVLNGLTVPKRDVLSLSQLFRMVVPPLMSTNVSFLFPCVR